VRQIKLFIVTIILLFSAINIVNVRTTKAEHHIEPSPLGVKQQAKMLLQPAPKANLNPAVVDLGTKILANETFGNEVFWTQILGLLNGSIEVNGQSVGVLPIILDSIDSLDGTKGNLFTGNGNAFTQNLVINIPPNTTLDGIIKLPAGPFATGLAVPKGSPVPVGVVPVAVSSSTPGSLNPSTVNSSYPNQNFTFGVSCSLCHEVVLKDGSRMPGMANNQLQIGAIFAFSSNSAALFPLGGAMPSDIDPFKSGQIKFDNDGDGIVDKDQAIDFERLIDEEFLLTPKGYFDVTLDARTNPTQTPVNSTNGNQPLLWDGLFDNNTAGLTDNFVHTVLLDVTSLTALVGTPAQGLFPYLEKGSDSYLTTLIQRSPTQIAGKTFADIDPQPNVAGILARARAVPVLSKQGILGIQAFLPNPGISTLSQDNAAEEAVDAAMTSFNGIANTSIENKQALDSGSVLKGAKVFIEADCLRCHPGPFFTANTITALEDIGTEPTRAKDSSPFKALSEVLGTTSVVGYKTQAKRFLFATAPYLHDGGMAAARSKAGGPIDIFGVVATLFSGIEPEPRASLEIMLNPELKAKAIQANKTQKIPFSRTGQTPSSIAITGEGHNFFVAPGMPKPLGKGSFKQQDVDNLINFLLALDDDPSK